MPPECEQPEIRDILGRNDHVDHVDQVVVMGKSAIGLPALCGVCRSPYHVLPARVLLIFIAGRQQVHVEIFNFQALLSWTLAWNLVATYFTCEIIFFIESL